jgi:PiT family inorganic phosphate transporter
VKPAQGFAAETSTAVTVLASSHLGFALSTTQVASGSVIGSGLGRRGSSVRWRTARRIGLGWVMTLPAAAGVGALAAWAADLGVVGVIIDTIVGVAVIVLIFVLSNRNAVNSRNAVDAVSGVSEVAESVRAVRIGKVKPLPKRSRRRGGKAVSS